MTMETRREFTRHALQSLTALALIEGLSAHRLFGERRPADHRRLVQRAGRDQPATCTTTRSRTSSSRPRSKALYRRVDLPALLKTLDFDRIAAGVNYPALGAKSLPVDFNAVPGLPTNLVFGRQIFAMKKGRSVVPHGHDNMATGFLVLNGDLRGRHYDRVEDHKDHYLIRPTIDRTFTPGEFSTISDHKDNVHWFTAESDHAFIFNIHVLGTNPENPKKRGAGLRRSR